VALALAAIIVAGCCAGSTPTHYGCGTDNDGPAWPIVDGKAVIPPGTRSVPDYAFYQCTSLVSVTIPNSVTSIGDSAFFASSLVSVEIPALVASIGSYAFYYCTSLASFEIPASVTSIGSNAFGICSSLVSITIPYSVTSIGSNVFNQCTGLVSVEIPTSVTRIGGGAFSQCISLVSVEIPTSVASIGEYAFAYCTSLVSVTIPSSVTSIGVQAFAYCTSLVSVEIPTSVASIGIQAFIECGCNGSMYVAGATVCDCAASPTWPCTGQQFPACGGRDLAACSVYSDRGVGMCCELEVHDCVCVAQGTAAEIAGICGGLKNGGIDCDQCKASPRCSPQLGLADE